MLLMLVLIFFGGTLLFAADFVNSRLALEEGLTRNSYGAGSRTERLEVTAGEGERRKIEVQVSEQAYSGEELKSMFQRCIVRMDKLILGTNRSLDHIESDMNLPAAIEGVPIEIAWELDRYDVMNVYGEIQEEGLAKEGTLVALKGVLTYSEDPSKQVLYERTAMVFPKTLNEGEQQAADIEKVILETDKKTQTEKILTLPRELDGKPLLFFAAPDSRGAVLMAMAVLIGILLLALEKQNQERELSERRAQMQLDYPEIINKLTLLLGAGMTVKRAWRKITMDYEEEKHIWGVRHAYEEMRQACNEMDSGITEAESYERFGRRCGLQTYTKLGALLSQNLRKGTKGLNQILRTEAIQSFEERKARAKRLGEEAGTKLLAPMFLMLAVVLVIVIVPAFMSVQM